MHGCNDTLNAHGVRYRLHLPECRCEYAGSGARGMAVHLRMKAGQVSSLGPPGWATHGGTACTTLCLWRPCVTTETPGENGSMHCAA